MIVLHLKAPNDVNGNPRRCYVMLDPETGNVLRVADEGYMGRAAIGDLEYVEGPQINITATEYRSWIRSGGAV